MAIEDFYNSMTKRVYTKGLNTKYEQTATSYTDTTINGHIGPRASTEQNTGGKFTIRTQYDCCSDTLCNYADEIIYNSETYRVVDDFIYVMGHHYEGKLEKIDKNVE
ncbi:MAG: hypothetical protein A3K77_06380 [Euryarchaeota archaeon RBG_13_31_8]|nr:MAG: hypothetical protein A3K77_06380 [Euryarchaeota archaeon RBG_13_31_8]